MNLTARVKKFLNSMRLGCDRRGRWLAGCFAVLSLVCLGLLIALYVSGYMPGTLSFDESGFAHGTGRRQYFYDSGELMLDEYYRAGKLAVSRWYKPDGSLLAETRFHRESGVGYYLRQDGSIRVRLHYRSGLADGPAEYFDREGNQVGTAVYREGQRIAGGPPPP